MINVPSWRLGDNSDLGVHMLKRFAVALLVAASLETGMAQTAAPTIYIQPTDDGFHTYMTAAMLKKKVPLTVTTVADGATYTLSSAQVEVEKVTTGRKVVNCLFAYCGGNEDKASTSVTMVDSSGAVVWSYAVNKGRGSKNRQSMAEAIAKHLGNHFKNAR
jgi:hypothetical protein